MKSLAAATFLALLLIGPQTSSGQVQLGGQVDYGENTDLGLGGRSELGLPTPLPLRLLGTFDYFFPERDDLDYWEANANLTYTLPIPTSNWSPYFGGGLNVAHIAIKNPFEDRSRTELGANLLGGFKYVAGPIVPFGEVRVEISGGEQFVLAGGLLFTVGP